LKPLSEVASPETDREWARRGPNWSPFELDRKVRQQRGVSADEAKARRDARELRWWWERDTGMLGIRGRLPDIDGALVKTVLERMIERMRPATGEPWDTRAHRGADALVELAKNYSDRKPGRTRAHITFHVPPQGPAECDGIPLADETVADLLDDATVVHDVVDDGALPGTRTDTDDIPEAVKRFVSARDGGHCRVGACECTDVEYHHLVPRSEGGTHDAQNLVLAGRSCGHHRMLTPNGPWILEGDPSQPDGLTLRDRRQLARAP
ncbi:MAG TPA: HNH endonuclease, partial [Nocardioides sp.]|nr:HNH endonuclease [Nocardioides sp.]